jgi:flagellar basal-body rod protein FlgB
VRLLFGKVIPMLSSVLDYRSERQKLISTNVANIETENYRPKELEFKNHLLNLMGNGQNVQIVRTHGKHLPLLDSKNAYRVSVTGDRVSLDKEMMNLAENNLSYNVSTDILTRKFKGISNFLKDVK